HLGERDCSVQRRHQKVIEEAPSPAVSPALRAEMGAAAVRAAAAVGYVGAGTVEFLLDADGSFYFLEMNTRLQVEHPVTELVTGLDLVAMQLRVALGRPLGFQQEDVRIRGHAIEARLYAEEPGADYAPRTGRLTAFSVPEGAGLRCDAGVRAGDAISAFYDPMLAKIMATGPDRDTARRRLHRMLEDTVVGGVVTNRAFLGRIVSHPGFASGAATTRFLDSHPDLTAEPSPPDPTVRVAIAAHLARTAQRGFRNSHRVPQAVVLDVDGIRTPVALGVGRPLEVDGAPVSLPPCTDGWTTLAIGGRRTRLHVTAVGRCTEVQHRGHVVHVGPWDPSPMPAASHGGDGIVRAPSAGTIVALPVAPGDRVEPGTAVAVVEAMKLEASLRAGVSGIVAEVRGTPGVAVAAGDILARITPDMPPTEEDP
ncbi:MAG: biotin/lipoyl-containing protein, partial [Myxococcota bacterium]|nr:biotin/lipoyl-containing protein [Myxococcota bacterium]